MIHINTESYSPPDKWQKRARELTKQLEGITDQKERNEFINKKSRFWSKLKNDFKTLSYGKCWFSEARDVYSYPHVDHFRPKCNCVDLEKNNYDGYWWLAFDWTNYRLCGAVGNVNKKDQFAVKYHRVNSYADCELIDDEICYLLDPVNKEDVKLLTFNDNGQAIPSDPNKENWNHQRAKYTVEVMDLDYNDLKEERKRIWCEMSDLIVEINERLQKYNNAPTKFNQDKLEALKEKVRYRIAPCAEFSSLRRACLRASYEDWALQLLEENLDLKKYCKSFIN